VPPKRDIAGGWAKLPSREQDGRENDALEPRSFSSESTHEWQNVKEGKTIFTQTLARP
jgi:hypothetical protein